MIYFSTRLYENADVLKRYLLNNCLVALCFFPLAVVIAFFRISLNWDFGFWGFLCLVYSFYVASYLAFREETPGTVSLCLASTLIWTVFAGLTGVAGFFARTWGSGYLW